MFTPKKNFLLVQIKNTFGTNKKYLKNFFGTDMIFFGTDKIGKNRLLVPKKSLYQIFP
jgi:hypothetical protein